MVPTRPVGLIGSDAPRRLPYRFGQVTLRRLALTDTARFSELARTGRLAPGLEAVWGAMAEKFPEADRFPSDGFAASTHEVGGRTVVIVTLPKAEHINEPYLVGVVLDHDSVERYLVLEHSLGPPEAQTGGPGRQSRLSNGSMDQGRPGPSTP